MIKVNFEYTILFAATVAGVGTAADSTPAAVLWRNGSASGVSVTVSTTAQTGLYKAVFTTDAGWSTSDYLELYATATIAGTAGYLAKVWSSTEIGHAVLDTASVEAISAYIYNSVQVREGVSLADLLEIVAVVDDVQTAVTVNPTELSSGDIDTIIAGVQAVHLGITEAVENCGFTITSSDTWLQSVTGLGDLTDKRITFAIKSDRRDPDASAIVLIDEVDGLKYLNGSATTSSWGSITIDDESAGDITLRLESSATRLIPAGKYVDAIKVIKDNADFSLRNAGTTTVLCGVIKETS